jgi:H/ACA ribonucleoprotein complex non-core subunit NAF1
MRESLHGCDLFLVKRTLRLINHKIDKLKQMKGCDASNMFDEELAQEEQEFSDDENEKEQRRMKKLRRAGKLEEGEIPSDSMTGKKRLNNDNYSSHQKNVKPS